MHLPPPCSAWAGLSCTRLNLWKLDWNLTGNSLPETDLGTSPRKRHPWKESPFLRDSTPLKLCAVCLPICWVLNFDLCVCHLGFRATVFQMIALKCPTIDPHHRHSICIWMQYHAEAKLSCSTLSRARALVCDGTHYVKLYLYRYFFLVPNIFDTNTGTFSVPNFPNTGSKKIKKSWYREVPVPVRHTLARALTHSAGQNISQYIGCTRQPQIRPRMLQYISKH